MDVTISRSVFSRRRNAPPPRRPKAEEVLSQADLETYNVARIKSDPGEDIFNQVIRPINPVCLSCVLSSQTVIQRNYLALGSHNAFDLRTMDRTNPFYIRIMPEFWYYMALPNVFKGLKTITAEELKAAGDSVLVSGQSTIDDTSIHLTLKSELASRFNQMFGSFRNRVSTQVLNFWTRITCWIMGKIFSLSFEAICVHYGEIELVKAAVETGLSIIFVPLYRSHLDSFLINWTLVNKGIRPPEFVTPHGLIHTPILGSLAKILGGLGCYRRRRASALGYLNRDVNIFLLAYINLLLTKSNSVMIPLETHRSRTGKPSTYLVGREFFNIVLKLYDAHEIEDAFIIPVSVNYDILPEEDLVTHHFKDAGPKPSFRGWWGRLRRNLGFVRISFSQPFRLREFKLGQIKSTRYVFDDPKNLPVTEKATVTLPGTEFNWVEEHGSVTSLSSIYGETDRMEPADRDVIKTNAIVEHSFFDASKTSVFMSTHLVAFLILKKFPLGIEFKKLVLEFEILEVEIRLVYKRDLGFTVDDSSIAVERAIHLLGPDSVQKYYNQGTLCLKPDSRKTSLLKLNYYANNLVSLYVLRGIVTTGLLTCLPPSIWIYADYNFTRMRRITAEESDVISKSVQIGELLKSEFLLYPPCKRMTGVVMETLEKMKDAGDLEFDETQRTYQDEDDPDYDYLSDGDGDGHHDIQLPPTSLHLVLINTSEVLNRLKFLRSLIVPYLQFYAVAVQALKILLPPSFASEEELRGYQGMEDQLLRNRIYEEIEKSLELGYVKNEELITMDVIRNFLHTMEAMQVIRYYADQDTEWMKMYYLETEYETEPALDSLSTIILGFFVTNEAESVVTKEDLVEGKNVKK